MSISPRLQAHYDRMKKVFETPDPTIITKNGRDWARVLAKICPWCKSTFYTYGPLDNMPAPHRDDLPAPFGLLQRETCGHPLCHQAEQKRLGMSGRSSGDTE